MTPKGFTCLGKKIGIKEDAPDFALICSAVPAAVAAVFTRSTFCGAPVILGRELIKNGKAQAFLITSGVSNVATGKEGLDNARLEMEALAKELAIEENLVWPFATGVIGVQLPMEKILPAIAGTKDELGPDQWEETAEAILTTDTRIKLVRRSVGKAVLVGMAKGAGYGGTRYGDHALLLGDRCRPFPQGIAIHAEKGGGPILPSSLHRHGYQHERCRGHNGQRLVRKSGPGRI